MPGTFFGFNTALRGMQAQQRGIYTTSHNIANANTDGYTRQRAVLAPTLAYPVPAMNHPGGTGWQIGTGVDIRETRRLRDEFLDSQIRRETGSLGQWEQMQDILKQVEIVFNEPSATGFNTLLSQFWASWQELAKNAESSPVRTTVVETANALAEAFRHSAAQLNQIKDDIDQTIDLKVKEVNSLAQQIADLNGQIKNIVAANDQPNDLMDQRDLLLDQLSKIVKVSVEHNDDGTIKVTLDGAPSGGSSLNGVLINGTTHNSMLMARDISGQNTNISLGLISSNNTLLDVSTPILKLSSTVTGGGHEIKFTQSSGEIQLDSNPPVTASPGTEVTIKDNTAADIAIIKLNDPLPANDVTLTFDVIDINGFKQNQQVNGEIKGLLKGREDVDGYLTKLNKLATELAAAINIQHQKGFGIENSPEKRDFFVSPSGTIDASNIAVNDKLLSDPMLVAASTIIDPQLGVIDSISGLDQNAQYKILISNDGGTVTLQKKTDGSSWSDIASQSVVSWDGSTITLSNGTESLQFTSKDYSSFTPHHPPDGEYTVAWPPAGDGSNALAIAGLQHELISGLSNATFDDYYKNFTAELGVDAHEATRMTTNQGVLVDQLTNRKESISGVSLDEEMANMLQYQRAYEASARMITTLDSMLDKIINGMGVTR
ncbi:MAG: flagellar hook-associated protein 1 [Clostridia bacterium]|nr:flagellar hook-associated protein 1 [Clostridia bacterium]